MLPLFTLPQSKDGLAALDVLTDIQVHKDRVINAITVL
jgi:hypothetical protein